ncbi:MAG: protein kinase [Planctomycetes bacterium]|nr:protein kinase [Planctomycetota bacterium]
MNDDRFEELLVAYDESLARGTLAQPSSVLDDPVLRQRLTEASACLNLLELAFPRRTSVSADEEFLVAADSQAETHPKTIGRFIIRRELGRGGHGVVFLALDPVLKREVALKVPRSEFFSSTETRLRFRREAEAAARLEHPHLVPIFEAGEVGPICYLVSAYCPGPTLATWLRDQSGRLAPIKAIQIVAPLADAVGAMHRQGILHRDLKPGNVILQSSASFSKTDAGPSETDQFLPRITDFGLAQFAEETEIHTRTGAVIGTPGYMSPEQAEGQRSQIGPATDVYALGVLLYELLTGRVPFQGATDLDTLRQIRDDDPLPLRKLRREISRDLETVVLKCLEKEPAQRYAHGDLLSAELRRLLRGEPIRARPVGVCGRTVRWCRRRPVIAGSIGTTLVALLALLALFVLRQQELSTYNGNLERLNGELLRAAQEADEQRQIAEGHARQVSEGLYAVHMTQAAQAVRAGDTRDAVNLLNGWIPRRTEPDLRGFEYGYLQQQLLARGREYLSTGSALYIVGRSPDRHLVAAAGKASTVWMFDENTGDLIRTIVTDQIEVNGVAFSPTARELATAGDDGTICFWNLDTGMLRLRVTAHPEKAYQVVYLDNGAALALCGSDRDIRIIDSRTGDAKYVLRGHASEVQSLILSRDGRTLYSTSSDFSARAWDLNQRTEREFYGSTQRTGPVDLHPQRPWIAIGNDSGTIEIRRLSGGEMVTSVEHLDQMKAVAWHPDGTLLAAGDRGGSIRLWKVHEDSTQVELTQAVVWHAHQGGVESLSWSANGQSLVSAGDDGRVAGWQIDSLLISELKSFPVARAIRQTLLPQTDLVVTSGEALRVWNWRTGEQISTLLHESTEFLTSSGDARLLAVTAAHGILRVFGGPSAPVADRFQELAAWDSGGYLSWVEISPDAQSIAVACWQEGESTAENEHSIWILSLPHLQQPRKLPPHLVSRMAYAPDGKRLALRNQPGLALWSLERDELLWEIRQPDAAWLTFSPDGTRLISRIDGRSVVVLDTADGSTLSRPVTHLAHISALALSRDGRTLATGDEDGVIRLSHIPTSRPLFDLPQAAQAVRSLAFSADGRSLICLCDGPQPNDPRRIVVYNAAEFSR